MKHVISFLASPLGYAVNFAATVGQYAPTLEGLVARPLCWACETFCRRDGVQDSPLF